MHCVSPAAHSVATSKVAVIFTGRLKRGNQGPFYSRNAFNTDFDNSTRQKKKGVRLETRLSPFAVNDRVPLLSFRDETKTVTLFYLRFSLVMATQKK